MSPKPWSRNLKIHPSYRQISNFRHYLFDALVGGVDLRKPSRIPEMTLDSDGERRAVLSAVAHPVKLARPGGVAKVQSKAVRSVEPRTFDQAFHQAVLS